MVLLAYAAPKEGEGVAAAVREGCECDCECIELGVGKTSAAFRLTRRLVKGPSVAYVFAFGVCGAYRSAGLNVGDLCVVDRDQLADEGVDTPSGFLSVDELGLGSSGPFAADVRRTAVLASTLGVSAVRGATVSRCSGTDVEAAALVARTGASVETMEGAAIASVCQSLSIPWVAVRAVSNFAGDRDRQAWQLGAAIEPLTAALICFLSKGGAHARC